jgi:hypothetical protein
MAAAIATLFLLAKFGKKTPLPTEQLCSQCGAPARHGHSMHAETEPEDIKPLCNKCLTTTLQREYSIFLGRAVVIEPVDGLPCYAFQDAKDWKEHFPNSAISDDTEKLLSGMKTSCSCCDKPAHYLWVESAGLDAKTFTQVLDDGISVTLLKENPPPVSLCGKCAVEHIAKSIEKKNIRYLEVCPPKGETGFVIPMGY